LQQILEAASLQKWHSRVLALHDHRRQQTWHRHLRRPKPK
jgi:hypothetical protein